MEKAYREVPHTADVALEAWGHDLPALFANAAEGLFSLLVDLQPEAPVAGYREVYLSAVDPETLLVDWLNELLSLYEEHGEAYVAFEVRMPTPTELAARIAATRAFSPRRAIKAATFHNLAIHAGAEGYHAVIVFDV